MSNYPLRPIGSGLSLALEQVDVVADAQYRIAGVRGFGNGAFARGVISGNETSYKTLNRLRAGNLVMSRLKAFEGAIAFVPEDLDGYYASAEFPTFEVMTGEAEPRYLMHLCSWPTFWQMLQGESRGIGARRERVSAQRLLSIEVPLPDLNEQCQVAAKLDAAMSRLTQVAALRNNCTQIARQHADSLFRSVAKWAPLSVALRQSRNMITVEPGLLYDITGIYSFGRGLIKRPTILGSDTAYASLTCLRAGQVVMSKLNAWEGALAVVGDAFDNTYVSPEYPSFDINDAAADPSYIEQLLDWPELWSSLTPRGSMVRRKRTTPATLLATEVPLPSLPEQRLLARQLMMIRQTVEAGVEQTAQVAALRLALLDAAFSGQL